MFTHYLLITGCEEPGFHGDGYCTDVNNNEACFFDGGDCCGSNVNTDWCNVCQCLEEGKCNQDWIADGYCDDTNNNLDCSYDGGDCCGSNVITQHCSNDKKYKKYFRTLGNKSDFLDLITFHYF